MTTPPQFNEERAYAQLRQLIDPAERFHAIAREEARDRFIHEETVLRDRLRISRDNLQHATTNEMRALWTNIVASDEHILRAHLESRTRQTKLPFQPPR